MKGYINDFYTYDLTGIIHNDDRSDESDIGIYLELTWKKNDKEEVEVSAPVIDDEMTSKLLRPDTVCINIDDG